jgi:hypothetical protein
MTPTPLNRRQFSIATGAALVAGFHTAQAQEERIVLGQSAAFTGPAAQLGIQFHAGAKLYFDLLNAQGGVGRRAIEIRQLDDGYEPDRCVANTKKLIDDDVFALFGYIGTPTSVAALPLATKARMPFFAPFTGAMALRDPFSKTTFHLRASYNDETALIVKQLTNLGLKKIAVFYQNDAYGKAGLDGVTLALAAQNLKPVALARWSATRSTWPPPWRRSTRPCPTPWCRSAPTSPAPPMCALRARPALAARSTTCPSSARKPWPTSWARTAPAWWCRKWCPHPTTRRDRSRASSSTPSRRPATCSPTSPAWRVTWPPRCLPKGFAAAASPIESRSSSDMESINDQSFGGFAVTFSPTNHVASKFVELSMLTGDGRVRT